MSEIKPGDTLVTPANQPPTDRGKPNTPPASVPDPVEELKNEVAREKARAATALQETAEKRTRDERILRINAEKKLKALGAGGKGDDAPPAGTVNAEEGEAEVERLNAEKGIANLLMMTPEYQALLQKDETLKEVLLSNPLSLISDYIDAEDAVDQIKKKLDKRIASSTGKPAVPPADGDGKPAPKPGDVPPPSSETVEMKGNITPDAAVKMSPEEWSKLPAEQKQKLLLGEF
jgi:hypothetical protein